MQRNGIIFVLWAAGLEEIAATIFVTELRRMGLRVKVVGLRRRAERGAFGLGLLPDLSLEQAAIHFPQARCLIVPGPVERLAALSQHPRLGELLNRMSAQGIFVSEVGIEDRELDVPLNAERDSRHWFYKGDERLICLARKLAERLVEAND